MLLIRNADVYAPEHLGICDVLCEGEKIIRIGRVPDAYASLPECRVIDAEGRTLVPGYIDIHEHITGGGGEGGPTTRVPEAPLSCLIRSGVTTVVGLLGTDGITRSPENLLAKARSFNEEGITCYILTGSYGYPPVTITGSVEKDLVLIDLCIGVKTAASDHRSSNITAEELIRLGTEARRGGMLAGKAGFVTIHMGSGSAGIRPLFDAAEHSDLPMRILLPTHMGRTSQLIEEGIRWIAMGGNIDITAGDDEESNRSCADKIIHVLDNGGESHLTVSSDGFGSMPKFNEKKELIGLTYSTPESLHQLLRILVGEKLVPLEKALKLLTSNPADILTVSERKGHIREAADADLILYDQDMNIDTVIARGRIAMQSKEVLMKGRFE